MHTSARRLGGVFALGLAALLVGCERPPTETVQRGYRGTGMVEVYNPRTIDKQQEANKVPEPIPAAAPGGPSAASTFKNVKVLNDLSAAEFTRVMVAITSWVSPKEGCAYCHQGADFADDSLYTKVVARRMLEMTRHINADWKNHVAETGVTCYTCHRGQPVPQNVWFTDPGPRMAKGLAGGLGEQNLPAAEAGLAALPHDPLSRFLVKDNPIRVVSGHALPTEGGKSIPQTEWTYALMMYMSESLGVNCTYCHNSRSFAQWETSSPPRTTAWYGIRLARDLNTAYLEPLSSIFPKGRLGPLGDPPKVGCGTCHQGVYKPLYGATMAKDYPELGPGHGAPAPEPEKTSDAADAPGVLGKILFETGSRNLDADNLKVIDEVARQLQGDAALNIAISGYADKSGNADKNLELAKQRAFAVRDALKTAGVHEDRIELKKPAFVIGAAQADSRRVDIVTQ